jgi:peptidoglycan/xylan/chitin deacetylase (PgdA/CDA1 family)
MNRSRLVRWIGPRGGYALARVLARHHPRILMYHRFSAEPRPGFVSAATFDAQVRHLAERYKPTDLSALARCFAAGDAPPPNTVVLTVDDGYGDFHDVAWPILQRHGVPATLFVTTGFVDGELWLWPDQLREILDRAPSLPSRIACCELELDAAERAQRGEGRAWDRLVELMLALPDAEKHRRIAMLAEELSVELPEAPPAAYAPCTWDQLRSMQRQGLDVGGHTHTHPTLPKVPEDALPNELDRCRDRLDAELGARARPFCYPNGQPDDYSETVARAVERAGFTCAVVAHADGASHGDRYALRRHAASESAFQFDKAVSGVEWLGRRASERRAA